MGKDQTTRGAILRLAALSTAVASFYGQAVLAVALPAGALDLKDVNFTYPAASSSTTGVGLGAVNNSAFTSLGAGYVNVSIGGVWAIQNLPVDPSNTGIGLPGLSEYLNLPVGAGPLTVLGDFSPAPSATFPVSAVSAVINKTTTINVNAQGFDATPAGPPLRTVPPGAQPGPLAFVANALTQAVGIQPGHGTNIEQDVNQCAPASIANSLGYLNTRYGIGLTAQQQNIPGVNGNPANSLVAGLDQKMGRAQGAGVSWLPILSGKLNYLETQNIYPGLQIKHQVNTADAPASVKANVSSTGGTRTSTYMGQITSAFILSELAKGEDVELGLFWNTGGAHFVDLVGGGTILGVPWVAFQHDAQQGFSAATGLPSNNGGTGLADGGYGFSFLVPDANGVLQFRNFVDGQSARVVYVISQSVPEPTAMAIVAFAGVTALARRRREA